MPDPIPGQSPTPEGLSPVTPEMVQAAFGENIGNVINLAITLGEEPTRSIVEPLTMAMGTNGMATLFGSERFRDDLEAATNNSHLRPFGLEANTLSPDTKLILFPKTIYQADKELAEYAESEGLTVRKEGPQALLYPLNTSIEGYKNLPNTATNFAFIGTLVEGHTEGKYPVEADNRSDEFKAVVREGVDRARSVAKALSPEDRAKLVGKVAKVCDLPEGEIDAWVENYAKFDTELLKAPGLLTFELLDGENVEDAEEEGSDVLREELKLTARDFPEITEPAEQLPPSPWKEYGTNMWNRSHQLFGRYEVPAGGGQLRVDFRLDSTHMPAIYGFFDAIEVTQVAESGEIQQQVVLGQEVDHSKEMRMGIVMITQPEKAEEIIRAEKAIFPVIGKGEFDFANPETRKLLDALVAEKGTKPDVRKPLLDALALFDEGNLTRVEKPVKPGSN